VKDLDREVLASLAEHFLLLLLEDLASSVMRIDDLVADRVIDVGNLTGDLEVFDLLLNSSFGDDVLLWFSARRDAGAAP